MATQWQYDVTIWNGDWQNRDGATIKGALALNEMLRQRGSAGWELVNFGPLENIGFPTDKSIFVFKQPA